MNRVNGVRLAFACGAIVIAAQYGSNKSVDGRIKPEVNMTGVLVDSTGNSYSLDNITIAGRYSQIPMYQEPEREDDNPEINTARVDLDEVDELKTVKPEIKRYQQRDYIEVEILFKGTKRTKNRYIVPRTYTIRGEEPLGEGAKELDREFSFLALKSLRIIGQRKNSCCPVEQGSSDLSLTDQTITRTMRLIEEIEQTAQQLPATNNDLLTSIKGHLIFLASELKKTLHKWFA